MAINYFGSVLGPKYFFTEDDAEIQYCLSQNKVPNMFVLGSDEKIKLVLGTKVPLFDKPLLKTVITDKRVVVRTGIAKFDQYLLNSIKTVESTGILSGNISIILNNDQKIDLFAHIEPKLVKPVELTGKLNEVLQQVWANKN